MDPLNLTQLLGRTWVLEGEELMGLYRLDEGRCILLDSGQRHERQALAAALDQAGLTPVGVLSSHIHIDHSINNRWLRDTYGCRVAAPAGEVHLCRGVNALRQYQSCYSPGTVAQEYGDMACPVDCPVSEQADAFSFCGVNFSILHTPGHSLDHISVLTPDGVCYTGDGVFCGPGLRSKLPYALDLKGMLDSARRLEQVRCQAYLVPHRGTGPGTALADAARATRALMLDRAEDIRALVTRPMTWGELMQAVSAHFALRSSDPILAVRIERNCRLFTHFLLDLGALALTARDGLGYLAPGPRGQSLAQLCEEGLP